MNKAIPTLAIVAVLAAGLVLRPEVSDSPTAGAGRSAPPDPAEIRSSSNVSRSAITRQRDVTGPGAAREISMHLLEVVRVQPWIAHDIELLAGNAPDGPGKPQEIWVTPHAVATLPELGRSVGRVCRELHDRCTAYRFVVRTTAGSVDLPHRLIHSPKGPR